ncbi:MAG: DUF2442 domain-containing protein [Desulfobacca sp.]|uniref:DUF2442 domain-containing protein n=1 Tax=Desulfobacca sp. TaxID=2067990 RepID=UPI00404A49E1
MYFDILEAEYLGGYKIWLKFADGKTGVADLERFTHKSGVFKKLKDLRYFQNFTLHPELQVLTWENELDIAPETLYQEATGAEPAAWAEIVPAAEQQEAL